jgi:uncharacterized protein YjbI with pentapeptide repeats
MQFADFTGANLQQADFTGANLYGAIMIDVKKDGADFYRSDMTDVVEEE